MNIEGIKEGMDEKPFRAPFLPLQDDSSSPFWLPSEQPISAELTALKTEKMQHHEQITTERP